MKEHLIELIKKTGAVKTGNFDLTSGQNSNIYIDGKLIVLDSDCLYQIVERYWELLDKETWFKPKLYIGGPSTGANSFVGAFVLNTYIHSYFLKGFYVRKEEKGHGTKNKIEGHLPEGVDTIILDDVSTTGGSIQKAVDAVKERNSIVKAVCVIIDREQGAKERFESQGIKFYSLLKLSELL